MTVDCWNSMVLKHAVDCVTLLWYCIVCYSHCLSAYYACRDTVINCIWACVQNTVIQYVIVYELR